MDPKEIETVAEAIWLAENLDNNRRGWANQPERIKFKPRRLARAALEAAEHYRAGLNAPIPPPAIEEG